jgi:hypothetical protein
MRLITRQSRLVAQKQCLNRQELVTVGWTDPEGSLPREGLRNEGRVNSPDVGDQRTSPNSGTLLISTCRLLRKTLKEFVLNTP